MEEALFRRKGTRSNPLDGIGDARHYLGHFPMSFLNIVYPEKLTGWPWGEAAGRPMAKAKLLNYES